MKRRVSRSVGTFGTVGLGIGTVRQTETARAASNQLTREECECPSN